jgi:AAA ATPase domain
VIRRWAGDSTSRKSVFWLRDAAGTGKSTVAATMADEWLRSKRLAARFFFSPNSTATSILDHFCTALAKDMAAQIPSLAGSINTAIQESPIAHFNFPQQFERFILEPLQRNPPTVPFYMVIDAVDNCDPDGRAMLLEFLVTRLPSVRNLRALVTSRPLSDIETVLRASDIVQGRDAALLDKGDKTYHDIQVYVNKRLSKLTAEQRETIITHSEGLFLWASTACRMLQRSRRPAELMTQLLSAKTAGHLDELYIEALRQAVVDRESHDLMMNVLQFVIAAFQPISISTIEAFLPHNTKVNEFVQDLGGLLKDGHPERPIFVIHRTFREFISQAERANGFLIDLPSSHRSLAIACVEFLDRLERDMLQVDLNYGMAPRNVDILNSGAVINERIDTPTKYASSYWAHHASVAESSPEFWQKTLDFLTGKLLHWVELMSWRGNISACVAGLSRLHSKSRDDRGSKISFLVS